MRTAADSVAAWTHSLRGTRRAPQRRPCGWERARLPEVGQRGAAWGPSAAGSPGAEHEVCSHQETTSPGTIDIPPFRWWTPPGRTWPRCQPWVPYLLAGPEGWRARATGALFTSAS